MSANGKSSPHRPSDRLIHMTKMVSLRHQAASDLPWEKIEASADRVFDDVQRQDIFEVWREHEIDLLKFDQSPTIAEIEKLRDELIELSNNLYLAGLGSYSDPAKQDLQDHLIYYLGEDVGARLRTASSAAFKATIALKGPPSECPVVRDMRSPRPFAFRQMIATMRCKESDGLMRAMNWGLNPTYNSPSFEGFLTALLDRQVTSSEIRNAITTRAKKLAQRAKADDPDVNRR